MTRAIALLHFQTLAFAETAAQRHRLPVRLIERSRMVDSSGDVMLNSQKDVACISDHARRSLTALKGAPEPVPWPELRIASARSGGVLLTRVAPNAVEAVRSVAADRDTVFMVFVGTSPDSGRVMDLYAIESREYAGSIRLPVAPISIAAFRDGLAAVVSDPVPTLLVWQRARRPR